MVVFFKKEIKHNGEAWGLSNLRMVVLVDKLGRLGVNQFVGTQKNSVLASLSLRYGLDIKWRSWIGLTFKSGA